MPILWIIHRDAGGRAALARLAGAGEDTVLGAPTDDLFESTGSPDVVVLGLAEDFEAELEFVHRVGQRLQGSAWILVPEASASDEAKRLFDTLAATVLPFPPAPLALRRSIQASLQRRDVDTLSRRRTRDGLAERFSHWFADLELPDLLRALDPHLHRVPLVIRGEPGTGRSLVARYVHAFAGPATAHGRSRFVPVACGPEMTPNDILLQLRAALAASQDPCSVWLEDVDTLPPPVQRRLQGWIEHGLEDELSRLAVERWMAGASDDSALDREFDPRLVRALAGVSLRIPPLRHRADAIEPLVADTAARWCRMHGQPVRRFAADALEQLTLHPWPGNMREIEAVVQRTLAATAGDPISAVHLRFDELEPLRAPLPARRAHRTPAARPPVGPTASEADALLEPLFEVVGEADDDQTVGITTLESAPDEPAEEQAAANGSAGSEKQPAAANGSAGSEKQPAAANGSAGSEKQPAAANGSAGSEKQPAAANESAASLRRLVGAVAHEVRNPLTSIRTFAALLPQHFDDPEFRDRFATLVGQDVQRIERVVDQLQELSGESTGEVKRVDAASLLEDLLDERREQIRARNLLVLRELDRNQPFALGDPQQLHTAFRALIEKTIELVPERGDVYVASRHHPSSARGAASLRILIRYHGGGRGPGQSVEGVSSAEAALEFAVAEALIRAQGGLLTLDTTDSSETVLVVDLPAPDQT